MVTGVGLWNGCQDAGFSLEINIRLYFSELDSIFKSLIRIFTNIPIMEFTTISLS